MFKIGDFSRLTQVSVKTLRYYDEIGLLKPASVDRFTGYRQYTGEQMPRLLRILVPSMACVIHKGSYDGISQAYSSIMAWIEANGYRISGPNREVYLSGPEPGNDPSSYLTEIQFPVEHAS